MLVSTSSQKGLKKPIVKCGEDLPLRKDHGGDWTGWTSEATCPACLKVMQDWWDARDAARATKALKVNEDT